MSCGPRTADEKISCGARAAPKGGYMDGTGGGKPPARSGTYWWAGVGGRWSLLGSFRTGRLATPMDRLDRRGALFLDWAFAAFRDGERRGSRELPEDSSSSAGRSMSFGAATSLPLPGRGEGNGRAGSRDCLARLASNLVHRRSFSSRNRFAGSPVGAIRPSAEPAPLVSLPSLGARGGTGLQGLGPLDC